MAKAEKKTTVETKRKAAPRLPRDVQIAIRAAEDKKAQSKPKAAAKKRAAK